MDQRVIVFPYHDPDDLYYSHIVAITPVLKQLFVEAHVTITALTQHLYPQRVAALQQDSFYHIQILDDGLSVGEQFHALYCDAAQRYPADTVLHLAYIDRLAFALETDYQAQYMADVAALDTAQLPLIYQRSEKAWATHPVNYTDIEGYVTTIGKHVLGKSLDFAWCYMALTAAQLKNVMPCVHSAGISMVAEMVLVLLDDVQTCDVDWLAWEDPFILNCDEVELKAARESSFAEVQKRLNYTLPMVDCIIEYQRKRLAAYHASPE